MSRWLSVNSSLLLVVLAAYVEPACAEQTVPPNIIVVLVDDLGWADLGCYGADLHETPNIDQFAATALRFTQAYAASPVCTPTRASIMTGKYPARLGMTIWRESAVSGPVTRRGWTRAPSLPNLSHAETTLAEALQASGYATAHVGKWHLGGAEHYPETHGFDVNIGGTVWGAPATFFYPYRGPFGRNRELRYVPGLEWGRSGEYLTDRLTDEAISIIHRLRASPFFLYLSYHTVHTPIEAPPADVELYRGKLKPDLHHRNPEYAAMVHSLDKNFGRLLKTLDELHIDQHTVVVFASDNGGYINEYRGQQVTSNHPLRSGKGSLYEGGIRIPLIIRTPQRDAAGTTCAVPVITNDLYATCLELARATDQGQTDHDGVSLLPLLSDSSAILPRDALYFHYPHDYATTAPVCAVRMGNWKLLHYFEEDRDELYDLSADLGESRDLAGAQPQHTARLRAALDEWLVSVSAKVPQRVAP